MKEKRKKGRTRLTFLAAADARPACAEEEGAAAALFEVAATGAVVEGPAAAAAGFCELGTPMPSSRHFSRSG